MHERCDTIQENLPLLLNGSLSSTEIVETLGHITQCTACKRELAFLATAQKGATLAWEAAPTPDFTAQLWQRLESEVADARVQHPPSLASQTVATAWRTTVAPLAPVYEAMRFVTGTVVTIYTQIITALFPRLTPKH